MWEMRELKNVTPGVHSFILIGDRGLILQRSWETLVLGIPGTKQRTMRKQWNRRKVYMFNNETPVTFATQLKDVSS
jgi:hypothetical protein